MGKGFSLDDIDWKYLAVGAIMGAMLIWFFKPTESGSGYCPPTGNCPSKLTILSNPDKASNPLAISYIGTYVSWQQCQTACGSEYTFAFITSFNEDTNKMTCQCYRSE